MPKLLDQTVLCVGGASGMGYGVAEVALEEGAKVVVTSRRRDRADGAAERLGKNASGLAVDLLDEESVRQLFGAVGRVDHIVVTAGAVGRAAFDDTPPSDAATFLNEKLWGAHRLLWHARSRLSERGSICLTTGGYAQWVTPEAAHVHVAFAATEALGRAVAVAFAPVRCNVIRPGFVDTGLWDFMDGDEREALRRRERSRTLTGRTVTARDIGVAAVGLMLADAVTGCTVPVDGGRHLRPEP